MVDVKAQLELGWEIIKGLRYEFMGAVRYVKSAREHMITENSNMAEAYRADYTSTIRAKNKFLYKFSPNYLLTFPREEFILKPNSADRSEIGIMNVSIRMFRYFFTRTIS